MYWGVYIHIPFCIAKCGYCDFYSLNAGEEICAKYVSALQQEIKEKGSAYFAKWGQARTIYIGGGTPTALSIAQLVAVIETTLSTVGTPAEITVEANPCTVDESYLTTLKAIGVNRLSIGVQSFVDKELYELGRRHNAYEAIDAIHAAKLAGFTNISIDLMYGIPQQNLNSLTYNIDKAVRLKLNHISIYGLQLEEGTPFFACYEQGRLSLPDDNIVENMYDYIVAELPNNGYERYEISNFALPGYESQHNLAYWQDRNYLGFGAGAHSYLEGMRLENIANVDAYIDKINNGADVSFLEADTTLKNYIAEYCFLALRTRQGISEQGFYNKFAKPIDIYYAKVISELVERKLLIRNHGQIYLTELGMKLGNTVFAEFLL